MEAIRIKLSLTEVGRLISYLSTLEASPDPGILVLMEWQEKLWRRAITHRTSGKQLASYNLPVSVAVALWEGLQKSPIDDVLQLTLTQIDSVLTNRGMKSHAERQRV